jgi:hypothetical protein
MTGLKMALNLPVADLLSTCQNLLIAGMGGGYDIFCGLPIYLTLQERGQNIHLANLSFAELGYGTHAVRLTDTLVGVQAQQRSILPYFPELHLARWFREKRDQDVTVWCFAKTGARPLLANYRHLTEHLGIDGILLIDGGVDSLMRGNEIQVGTPVEDTLSLLAVNAMQHVPVRQICCLGFGAETDVGYAHVLENIAALSADAGFLGSCSLVKQMEVYRAYQEAVSYVHERSPADPSVINASVLSAVEGHFGNFHLTNKTRGSQLRISPLMPIYWFFALEQLAVRNMLMEYLAETDTFDEAIRAVLLARQSLKLRSQSSFPFSS